MKRPAVVLALLFAGVLAARLCHAGIVWVEEAYPAAAAIQILHGKAIYRDFWFDKPPLTAWLYLLWGAKAGVPLRVAGALFLFACCLAAYWFASRLWSRREGVVAALLFGFFLTFDFPSAAMALAPDLVTVLPHILAVGLVVWGELQLGRSFSSAIAGAAVGLAMLANPKAILLLPICLLWCWRKSPMLLAGFLAATFLGMLPIVATGALTAYWQQVWQWGSIYSRDTFIQQPILEGIRRTAAWAGFHATIVVAAALYVWRQRNSSESHRFVAWAVIAFTGVVLGWRFFPRYYFLLLPPVVLASARGLTLMRPAVRASVLALLLIPLIRFGPRYVQLAADALHGRNSTWPDLAMSQDSRAAARAVSSRAHPGDTLLVWGYRPDIFVYTRMPVGAPFLDSQPLTGVIADRHLTQSRPSTPELAARERGALVQHRPAFIVDGLGPYNPALAITGYPDLRAWLAGYDEVERTRTSIVYQLRR